MNHSQFSSSPCFMFNHSSLFLLPPSFPLPFSHFLSFYSLYCDHANLSHLTPHFNLHIYLELSNARRITIPSTKETSRKRRLAIGQSAMLLHPRGREVGWGRCCEEDEGSGGLLSVIVTHNLFRLKYSVDTPTAKNAFIYFFLE